ncbi:MAG: ribose transport system permease protein [Candidatus Atribacteria bacterium]|nr:ribose transport system permease protein [Candidatus Atribacteria bacterium]
MNTTEQLQKVGRLLLANSQYTILILFIVIPALVLPQFLTIGNITNVLSRASFMGIMAIGLMFPILIGGMDLSVANIYAFSSLIFAYWQHYQISLSSYDQINLMLPLPMLVLLTLMVGIGLGLLNGVIIAFGRIPDFAATLGTMMVFTGLAYAITETRPVFGVSEGARLLGAGSLWSIPIPAFIWLAIAILANIVLKYTLFGRNLYAVGVNRNTAYHLGIDIVRVQVAAYTISGFLAATAGILVAGWLNGGDPRVAENMLLPTIASVVLGGTSLAGGKGTVSGTITGVLIMTFITNILNLMGIPPFPQQIVAGLVIILALILQRSQQF